MRWFTDAEVAEPDFIIFVARRIIESDSIGYSVKILLFFDLGLSHNEISFLLQKPFNQINDYWYAYRDLSQHHAYQHTFIETKGVAMGIIELYQIYKSMINNRVLNINIGDII